MAYYMNVLHSLTLGEWNLFPERVNFIISAKDYYGFAVTIMDGVGNHIFIINRTEVLNKEKTRSMALDIRPTDEVCLRIRENDVRRSHVVKFFNDNRIAVEQTAPLLDNSSLMSLIFFTYCSEKQKNKRLGFQARIENITPDNRIIVRQMTTPFICDLRLWPRVHFDLLPRMDAFCHDRKIQVVDISGGGTHLILRETDDPAPSVGSLVAIKFSFENGETAAEGKILQSWNDSAGLRHISVQFTGQPEIRDFIYRRSHAA